MATFTSTKNRGSLPLLWHEPHLRSKRGWSKEASVHPLGPTCVTIAEVGHPNFIDISQAKAHQAINRGHLLSRLNTHTYQVAKVLKPLVLRCLHRHGLRAECHGRGLVPCGEARYQLLLDLRWGTGCRADRSVLQWLRKREGRRE